MDSNERIQLAVGERKQLPFDISEAGPGTVLIEIKRKRKKDDKLKRKKKLKQRSQSASQEWPCCSGLCAGLAILGCWILLSSSLSDETLNRGPVSMT